MRLSAEPSIEHAIQAIGFLDVAFDRVRDLLGAYRLKW